MKVVDYLSQLQKRKPNEHHSWDRMSKLDLEKHIKTLEGRIDKLQDLYDLHPSEAYAEEIKKLEVELEGFQKQLKNLK